MYFELLGSGISIIIYTNPQKGANILTTVVHMPTKSLSWNVHRRVSDHLPNCIACYHWPGNMEYVSWLDAFNIRNDIVYADKSTRWLWTNKTSISFLVVKHWICCKFLGSTMYQVYTMCMHTNVMFYLTCMYVRYKPVRHHF